MNNSIEKKNILFSAHELSPYLGSECSSAWNLVLLLSKYHKLTVIYAETNQFNSQNYREHLEKYFSENELPQDLIFIPVKQPMFGQFIAKINRFVSKKSSSTGFSTLYFLSYRFWQRSVIKIASSLIAENKFDLIHQFNSLSYREPGYLFKLNLPFIWGPISGLDNLPKGYFSNIPVPMLINSSVRNFSNYLQFNFSFRIHAALRKASRVYAVTSTDKLLLSTRNKNVINLLDVGANLKTSIIKERNYEGGRRLKLIWVGRLDYLKALDIILFAFSKSHLLRENAELLIVGKGPQENYFKNIANKLKLNNLIWLGHVEKDKVESLMMESDLLVHTSIKEAASAVILEALSCGLPVVCHNSFGMSHAINNDCGIKVPFKTINTSIEGFREALEYLIQNQQLVNKFSSGAYSRSRELSWNSLAEIIANDYKNT